MKTQLTVEIFLQKISSILVKIIGVERLEVPITLQTSLVHGVGVNGIDLSSIDYVRLLVDVEEEYDVIYDFNTMIYTVGDIYDYINEFKNEREE